MGKLLMVDSGEGFEVFEVVESGFRIPGAKSKAAPAPLPRQPDEDEFANCVVMGGI